MFEKKEYFRDKFKNLSSSKQTLSEIEFEDCEFTKCVFIETKFKKCKFIDCRFSNCTFSACKFTDSTFLNATFTGSKLMGIDWTELAKSSGWKFRECSLEYCNFKLMKLPGIEITRSNIKDVDFTDTDLSRAMFNNSSLDKSKFFKTNLEKASFLDATNYSINAQYNNITKAKFSLPEALTLLYGLDIKIEN